MLPVASFLPKEILNVSAQDIDNKGNLDDESIVGSAFAALLPEHDALPRDVTLEVEIGKALPVPGNALPAAHTSASGHMPVDDLSLDAGTVNQDDASALSTRQQLSLPVHASVPALTNPALTNPALTNPALTNPALTNPVQPIHASPESTAQNGAANDWSVRVEILPPGTDHARQNAKSPIVDERAIAYGERGDRQISTQSRPRALRLETPSISSAMPDRAPRMHGLATMSPQAADLDKNARSRSEKLAIPGLESAARPDGRMPAVIQQPVSTGPLQATRTVAAGSDLSAPVQSQDPASLQDRSADPRTTLTSNGTLQGGVSVTASNASVASDIAGHYQSQAAPQASRTQGPAFMTLGAPVGSDQFDVGLQGRVTWMANTGVQSAEIRLNPADLGPIRVQVSVDDDMARVVFTAQHAVARDAIEQSLPRLRDMLSDNGLSLSSSNVSTTADTGQESSANANPDSAGENTDGTGLLSAAGNGEKASDLDDADSQQAPGMYRPNSLVDTFA